MIKNKMIRTSDTVIFEATVASAVVLLLFCNTSKQADIVDVHVVPKGSQSADENLILSSLHLFAADTFTLNLEKLILDSGDKIIAVSENGNIAATVSSMEIAV